MLTHRTQIRKETSSLISSLLKKRATIYPRLCLALRNRIIDEVSKDVHEDFMKLSRLFLRSETIKLPYSFFPISYFVGEYC